VSRVQKAALAVAVVIAVSIATIFAFRHKPAEAPKVETQKVERGALVAKVTASGTLSALVTVLVGSQVSGRIKEVLADFNSTVTKNQIIARIDPQLFVAALEQTRANLAAAEANVVRAQVELQNAERMFVRAKSIFDKQLGAQQDVDTAQTTRDSAKAQLTAAQASVQQARAAYTQAEVNLAYCTIHSPIDGIVISRAVDVGQTVAASLAAPTLFSIAEDLKKMQVDTNVAEADIGKVEPNMEAIFTVDAFPGERFKGKVRQIRNAPINVQNVVTYDAVIDVNNDKLKLKPGMTATVTFVVAQKDDVLKLPNATLRFRPPPDFGVRGASGSRGERRGRQEVASDERIVWRNGGEGPAPVKVKIGLSDGVMTEIVSGDLKEGDQLVTDVRDTGTGSSGGQRPGGGMGGPPGRLF
jgi:HlyD family secretion protein